MQKTNEIKKELKIKLKAGGISYQSKRTIWVRKGKDQNTIQIDICDFEDTTEAIRKIKLHLIDFDLITMSAPYNDNYIVLIFKEK